MSTEKKGRPIVTKLPNQAAADVQQPGNEVCCCIIWVRDAFSKLGWWQKYLDGLVTSPSNMDRVCPSSRVGLMRKRVRRYFYEIIVRHTQSRPIGAQYGFSIAVLGVWVFLVLLLFHIWILAPKLGVRWIRKLWALRAELWLLNL